MGATPADQLFARRWAASTLLLEHLAAGSVVQEEPPGGR
jgi:hypothetical protein